jgi:hypothetical protein
MVEIKWLGERVSGAVTREGEDISEIINSVADAYDLPPRVLLATGIAESNLNQYAERWGNWPDVSFGIWQQTVAFAPFGDQSQSEQNIAYVREKLFDIPFAADVAAAQLSRFWHKYGDGPETMGRYNWPARGLQGNPNYNNIMRGWNESEAYIMVGGSGDWAPDDVREQFPYAPGRGQFPSRSRQDIRGAVYHHGASRESDGSREDDLALLQEYWRLHTRQNGWPSIGYHFAVGPTGRVYWLNGLELVSYHAGEANQNNIGIVFLGNFEWKMPTYEAIKSAIRVRHWVAQQLGKDDLPYNGHRDYMGTTCPGNWWATDRDILSRPVEEEPVTPDPEPQPDPYTDLINWHGYLNGTILPALEEAAQSALRAETLEAAKEAVQYGIVPALETWRRGG